MSTKKKNRGKQPIRMCICCGKEAPKGDMLRVVVGSGGTADEETGIDETGKVRGRGAYICKNINCIERACKEGVIGESVKQEALENVRHSTLQLLAIAMKAGKISSGEFSSEEAVKTGTAELVIIAEDASENTRDKFMSKSSYYGIPHIVFGDKETLGRILGKNERSVVVVKDKDFSTKVLNTFGGNE